MKHGNKARRENWVKNKRIILCWIETDLCGLFHLRPFFFFIETTTTIVIPFLCPLVFKLNNISDYTVEYATNLISIYFMYFALITSNISICYLLQFYFTLVIVWFMLRIIENWKSLPFSEKCANNTWLHDSIRL